MVNAIVVPLGAGNQMYKYKLQECWLGDGSEEMIEAKM